MTAGEELVYYICPMDAHSATLVIALRTEWIWPLEVITANENSEFYGCPMLIHSHIREEKSGTCTDCGMDLKPMRLIK